MSYGKRIGGAAAFGAALALAGAFLVPNVARADTVVETFTFGTLSNYPYFQPGQSINAFDPTLGTLNSIQVALPATAVFSNGCSVCTNTANYLLYFDRGPLVASNTANITGNGSVPISLNATITSLAGFIGTGTIPSYITISEPSLNDAGLVSNFGNGTVTYGYTPATPVPEPASLALLATGILGLTFAVRRRRPG